MAPPLKSPPAAPELLAIGQHAKSGPFKLMLRVVVIFITSQLGLPTATKRAGRGASKQATRRGTSAQLKHLMILGIKHDEIHDEIHEERPREVISQSRFYHSRP